MVRKAIQRTQVTSNLEILAALGGFEIAAMTGAILEAAEQNTPVILDGYIVSSSALLAFHENNVVNRVLIPAMLCRARTYRDI